MTRGRLMFWGLLFASVLFGIYTGSIEPRWIEVTHHEVTAPVQKRIKIAVLADLHTDGLGAVEQRMLGLLEEEHPDLIVLPGDLVPNTGDLSGVQQVLAKLSAPLGVFYVPGNWEHWSLGARAEQPFPKSEAKLLLNDAEEIAKGVWLVGIDDALGGRPHPKAALRQVPVDVYKIGLFHSPSAFEQLAPSVDLAIAGHTHGGQIRLPGIGPLWLPQGSGRYVMGWYKSRTSKLYVSRGIGMSILPLRFLCRPEIAMIELVPPKPG